jgi:uncharacterized delta-60 repeat protein
MKQVRRVVLSMAALTVALGALAGVAVAKPASKPKGPGKATAAPGELDTTFGKGGKVTVAFPGENGATSAPNYVLPFEFTQGHLEMARAPEGKIVIAGATKVVRLLPNGRPDPTFGSDGTATIPRPPGALFVLAGVAVDSQGRVVLDGLARPLPTESLPDPVLSSAAVIRLDPNGSLDPSFGSDGMVISSLGLAAPKAGGGSYKGPSVGLRDVVIDAQNRPVVTGAYVTGVGASLQPESQGFVARLTESGALDQSFGEKGIRTVDTITTFGELLPRADGYLAVGEAKEAPFRLMTGFDPNGNLDAGFGSFGFRGLSFGEIPPKVAIAPSGKILLLGHPVNSTFTKKVHKKVNGHSIAVPVKEKVQVQTVQRLLPSGAADPSFGRIGRINYVDPKVGSFSALTADKEERIYLVGRVAHRVSKGPNNPLHRTQFLISRFRSAGGLEKSFGQEGTVTIGFGGPADAFATQVEIDAQGRILVGGGITSPQLASGGGFALARFLPGS